MIEWEHLIRCPNNHVLLVVEVHRNVDGHGVVPTPETCGMCTGDMTKAREPKPPGRYAIWRETRKARKVLDQASWPWD